MTSRHPARPAGFLFWFGTLGLILVVHATSCRLESVLAALAAACRFGLSEADREALPAAAAAVKAALFWMSFVLVAAPVARDARAALARAAPREVFETLAVSAAAGLILAGLVFQPGNVSMGTGYAARSLAPFRQEADWFHKRLLMPALAHALFFRGAWAYYAFGLLVTAAGLGALHAWLRARAPIPFWQFVSLCTGSFMIYPFQFPGYPDVLVILFLLLVMSPGFGPPAKLSLLTLALVAHEASLFAGLVLAWRFLDRAHFRAYLLALGIYGFAWLAGFGMRPGHLVRSHDVEWMSGIEWVILRPREFLLGLLAAFKALWAIPAIALLRPGGLRRGRDTAFLVLSLLAGVSAALLGVDTSRLAGFAFPAVLVSLQALHADPETRCPPRLLAAIFGINLAIPSVYVGLNTGPILRPGFYELVYRIAQRLF